MSTKNHTARRVVSYMYVQITGHLLKSPPPSQLQFLLFYAVNLIDKFYMHELYFPRLQHCISKVNSKLTFQALNKCRNEQSGNSDIS